MPDVPADETQAAAKEAVAAYLEGVATAAAVIKANGERKASLQRSLAAAKKLKIAVGEGVWAHADGHAVQVDKAGSIIAAPTAPPSE